jgi:hypothetical protein
MPGEVVETCTVWAVYTFPYVAKLYAFHVHPDVLIGLFGRGIPEVTYLTDGTERIKDQCADCARFDFQGGCPGPEAHAFAEWHIECTRTIWYPVEMGKFEVPANLGQHGRIVEVTRLIMQNAQQSR